jgi:polyphosphate kinase 2 (PPK2 family)
MLERLERPEKHWKFEIGDLEERKHWNQYMAAYEDMIQHTATRDAPWCVVPANHKWFTRLVVAAAVIDAMRSMHLAIPKLGAERREEIKRGLQMLSKDGA